MSKSEIKQARREVKTAEKEMRAAERRVKKAKRKAAQVEPNDEKKGLSKGGRNLLILVGGAIGIALMVTSVSLYIYHVSGDIYLDRSRPGYLPEEGEESSVDEESSNYKMSETGEVDAEVLEEYLKELEEPVETIDEMGETFGAEPLSDEGLGIEATTEQ